MGLFKIWKDHVTQYSNRYKEIQNADGTVTHESVEGEVIQEGTPQSAKNFNDLEERVLSADMTARSAMLLENVDADAIAGIKSEAAETNTENEKSFNDLKEKVLGADMTARSAMLLENVDADAIAGIKSGIAETNAENEKSFNDLREKLKGEIVETTLANTKEYPFNDSKKTLALANTRENLDYTVTVEASTEEAGGIGEIKITDKQLNGFKIEHTGAAKSVSVKCYVKGGYE